MWEREHHFDSSVESGQESVSEEDELQKNKDKNIKKKEREERNKRRIAEEVFKANRVLGIESAPEVFKNEFPYLRELEEKERMRREKDPQLDLFDKKNSLDKSGKFRRVA